MKGLQTIAFLGLLLSVHKTAGAPLAWPQFRGPGGTGVADDQKPPVEIGPDKNVKWKVAVPSGFSSPIVVGDLLVITAFEGGKLYTIAYQRADGKEVWRTEAPAKEIEGYHKSEGSPAASTCVTDGKHIVSYFGSCGLFCYDLGGNQLWKFELPTAVTVGDFGTGVSPILADGLVILLRDTKKDSKILALDLEKGSLSWEQKRQSPSSFCTPTIWDTPTGKQVVAPGYGKMVSYDLKTGKEQWTLEGMPSACCTTPVVVDDILFFAGWSPGDPEEKGGFKMPSFDDLLKQAGEEKQGYITKEGSEKTMLKGFFESNDDNKDGKITREEYNKTIKMMSNSRNSAFAIKAGGKGEVSKTHVLWKQTKGLPYVPSGIVYRNQFVMVKDGGLVSAYDAKTGKKIYELERAAAAGRYYASLVAANGNIYVTSLDEGIVTVLKAGTDSPEVVVTNPKLGERVAATPVIADNTLYIRTAKHLYAFASK